MRHQTNLVLALTVLATLAGGVGCTKSEGSNSASGPRSALAASGAAGITLSGTVSAPTNYQSQFQDAVTGFLSTDVNPSYVGTVSASPTSASGVFFGGQVVLSGGSALNAANATVTSGRFAIQVMDQTGVAGAPVIPEFALTTATGYIQSGTAMIQFSDSYGTVTLQGTINSGSFSGSMSYDNNVLYNGNSPGAAGTLGTFSIPTCQFFRC